jgi:DNA-binding NtrC family response regulator
MPKATPGTTESTRQRILVISGDPLLRERLYDTLLSRQFLVSTAISLENGLEILQRGEVVHLILLDGTVSHGKHVPFTDRIRHFDEKLPMILLTDPDHAPADTQTIRHVQACLSRDVNDDTLLSIIARWSPPQRPVKTIKYPGPILIVDDDRELLSHLEQFLQPRGCTVVKAASGEEALASLARAQPALVLLDIKMPGMDGLVTLKKIKALYPNLLVIMATAVEDQELMAQAFALGAYEHIIKPYNLTVLAGLLSSLKKRASEPFASSTKS